MRFQEQCWRKRGPEKGNKLGDIRDNGKGWPSKRAENLYLKEKRKGVRNSQCRI